jgi:dephospho-CoA kinase
VIRVALTGGLASGKSRVLRSLAQRGVPTADADRLAHEALMPATPAAAAVRARFGDGVVDADGGIDRRALAAIVFSDRDARLALEAIVHPAVYREIDRWFASLPSDAPFGVADIPLLYETGHETDFDAVIVAACPPEEQLRRAMARDQLSRDEASARLAAQGPIDEKVRRADHVIWTTGSFEETEAQIEKLIVQLGVRRPKL